ncbi:MAG: beta-ketoacyl synthase [Gammaproteobacteria bacterium]|nr:beta-ketoacyl synthase [Gammaproteobacteria bacterium]
MTIPLPIIAGFGGINAAGRGSGHQAYRRTVLDSLPEQQRHETVAALAVLMHLVRWDHGAYHGVGPHAGFHSTDLAAVGRQFAPLVRAGTLVRRLNGAPFDPDRCPARQSITVPASPLSPFVFEVPRRDLPAELPAHWDIAEVEGSSIYVTMTEQPDVTIACHRPLLAQAAGQLPDGYDPGRDYHSRFHPRALQMTLVAISDALRMLGIPWDTISGRVAPDQIGVYASSSMSQLDEAGNGGLLQARVRGKRCSAKNIPLGFNSMPADFVNAYVLGNIGKTSAITGACATFLYNLEAAVRDIRAGSCRVAIVGNAEAPLVPEVIDGYAMMNALATDEQLCRLDNVASPDYRRASRPFGENCGFVMGESAQYLILCDDALALELGADIHGAISDVFINADGYKKSIAAPGPGNYLTLARAVASAAALLGDDAVRHRSHLQAHGSSTPLNRVTESMIFDQVAAAFGIRDWPLTAVKACVGHSLGPASADQLLNTLGIFAHGLLPGIKTIDSVASDVHAARLCIPLADTALDCAELAFINAKGFGGNNASAVALAPTVAERLLARRHGTRALTDYRRRRETVRAASHDYQQATLRSYLPPIYKFAEVADEATEVRVGRDAVELPGYAQSVRLPSTSVYTDLAER